MLRRRTPPGVRELKLVIPIFVVVVLGRTPPGVRELKQEQNAITDKRTAQSHPSRGA